MDNHKDLDKHIP